MSRRATLLATLLGVLAAGVVTGLAGLSALSAADALERAQAGLTGVTGGGAEGDQALEAVEQARADLAHAERELARWPVDVVAAVPLLGRSWRAERAVTRTADAVLAGGAVLADGLPRVQAGAGGVDLTALARLHDELRGPARRSSAALDELRSTPLALTPAAVQSGVRTAEQGLGPAVDALQRVQTGLEVLPGVLGQQRPRHLLVMLQNNAELRGAGGYSSSFATGRLDGGRVTLEPLRDVLAVADPPERARRVPAPDEYVEDYGPLSGDTTIWRSWNMSPHVPHSAQVAARVAGALLPVEPDVVLLLDVPALGALAALGGTGVVLPGGETVQPQELTDALLVDTYAEAGNDLEVQLARRRDLQAAATAAVTRLLSGAVPAPEAARTVARLASGRHLTLWSADPQEQRGLVELGLAGELAPGRPGGDLFHLSVNNIGSNKLDVYVSRQLSVDVVVSEDAAEVVQRVRLSNQAPEDLVTYVAGYERPGVVRSRVELSLPPGARDVRASVDGGAWPGGLRRGEHRQRLHTRVELRRQESTQLEVRYVLPVQDGRYDLRLVPQPLAEDAELRLSVRAAEGRVLTRAGQPVAGLTQAGPLDGTRDVHVELAPRSRWSRIAQLWTGTAPSA